MEDPTTIALNLTFFGTVGVALIMSFGLFLAVVATLVIAGLGRLVAVTIMAAGRGLSRSAGSIAPPTEAVRQAKAAKPAKPAKKPAKKEPALSPDWAAAVAQADARAAARAKAGAAPAVKVSVRDLPSPNAPGRDLKTIAPLVESATDRNGQLGAAPPAFPVASAPAAKSLPDTGSLASPPDRVPLPRKPLGAPHDHQRPKPQARERKAG
ncbi:MAG: hypothetical protein ABWX85_06815 [Arthrobacter sp.]